MTQQKFQTWLKKHEGEIAPLEGGKTIADIHTESEKLKDQQVTLRAKVMKVSENILGKNWGTHSVSINYLNTFRFQRVSNLLSMHYLKQ